MFACIFTRQPDVFPASYADATSLLTSLTPFQQQDRAGSYNDNTLLMCHALTFNTADRWQDSAGNDCTLRPVQFLTSVYDDPMKIDMYHLFYNGVSPEQPD